MPNIHYSSAEKLAVLTEIESGQIGIMAAVKKFGIPKQTLAQWRHLYELYGYEGLERQTGNRSYSAELKLQAVTDYLYGGLRNIKSSTGTRLPAERNSPIGSRSIMVIAAYKGERKKL